MRRSHHKTCELVQARVADYVNGDSTESVLRASLKALGLDESDTTLEVWKAKNELLRTHHEYLKRKKGLRHV